MRRFLICLVVLLAAFGSPEGGRAAYGVSGFSRTQTRQALNVLFIGDSYIYVNNVADMLKGIAAGLPASPAIEVAMAADGGKPLGWHLANGPARTMLSERRWDWVVLQEHSLLGGYVIDGEPRMMPPRIFHSSARELVKIIGERSPGAKPVFFMTWARRGREAQEEAILTNAYLDIGRELGIPVSRIGTAFEDVKRAHADIDLFARDGGHPSPAGTYLAAAMLYASITGRNPVGAPARIEGHPWSRRAGGIDTAQTVTLADLPAGVAARLQEAAWRVTSSSPAVPATSGAR